MSRLTVRPEADPGTLTLQTEDPKAIADALATVGVRFERWAMPEGLSADAESDAILDGFRPHLDALMDGKGYGTVDVIRINAATPNLPAIRAKFLAEHIHTEDEVRFFVKGAGHFVLHIDGKVWDARCEAGDLISVPANTKHWFDAGPAPDVVALRIFTDTTGWTPHYTGDAIHERFPVAA